MSPVAWVLREAPLIVQRSPGRGIWVSCGAGVHLRLMLSTPGAGGC